MTNESAAALPRPRAVQVGPGRVVGVYEYGDPRGYPVLAFHGTPSCGATFLACDEAARTAGIRLLAPDRPGIGLSTYLSPISVRGYPSRVAELTDALGVERFAVSGTSGGGPYALACAALLPQRVSAAAITAGMGQLGVWAGPDDFSGSDPILLRLAAKAPWLIRGISAAFGRVAAVAPEQVLKRLQSGLAAEDRQTLAAIPDARTVLVASLEAVRTGARGVAADYAALARPWNVDVAAISVPLLVWHGDRDEVVPLRHAEELAHRVPAAQFTVWPGVGHLGVLARADEVFSQLKVAALGPRS